MRYKTKIKTIEAWRVDYDNDHLLKNTPKWMLLALYYDLVGFENGEFFVKQDPVYRSEPIKLSKGDYIILSDNGMMHTMSKESFENTFEKEH